jgi:hypothetical protein
MDLFDTLTWVEILVKTTFLGTPTLTVSKGILVDFDGFKNLMEYALLWYFFLINSVVCIVISACFL